METCGLLSLSLEESHPARRREPSGFNDRCFETRHGQSAGRKNMHFTRPVEYTLEYTASCVPSWLRPERERENTLGRVGLAVQTAHRRANAARLCAYRTRLAITRDEWRLPGIN